MAQQDEYIRLLEDQIAKQETKNEEYKNGIQKYEDLLEYLLKLRDKETGVSEEDRLQKIFTEKQFELLSTFSNQINSVFVHQS